MYGYHACKLYDDADQRCKDSMWCIAASHDTTVQVLACRGYVYVMHDKIRRRRCWHAHVQFGHLHAGGWYLIVLVCPVPAQQMLLYKQLLKHCVVYCWDGSLEVFVECHLGI